MAHEDNTENLVRDAEALVKAKGSKADQIIDEADAMLGNKETADTRALISEAERLAPKPQAKQGGAPLALIIVGALIIAGVAAVYFLFRP